MHPLVAAAEQTQNSSPWFSLIFFGSIFGAMYFLLLRPQRRRMKETQKLQSSLAVDDEVILTSGILGHISEIEGDVVWLDVASGHGTERIEIRVTRSSIARKTSPSSAAAEGN